MNKKALLTAAAMIALTACAGQELGKAQKVTPNSTEFDNALAAGYLRLAQDEQAESDYTDADYFAGQAIAAASPNQVVDVPEVATRRLPEDEAPRVATAREDLVSVLDGGARVKVPQLAAAAQVAYECWVQELEENFQPEHIAACRDQFDGLIPALRNAIAPQTASAPAPEPAKPPRGKTFKVFFDIGAARLNDAANDTLAEAVAFAENYETPHVVVSGYTDTVGSAAANERLSDRRAAVVAAALRIRGIARDAIKTNAFGEQFLDVRTDDGVAEAKNRRVEVSIAE